MATVIGIFEDQFKNNKPLTVVKPGTQSRRFTHINDTVDACYYAWKKNKCRHYSISIKRVIDDYRLLKCLAQRLNFYQLDLVKDMLQLLQI